MSDRRLRVAIVGAGLMGRWHAAAARHCGAAVTHVVDPDTARAARLARRVGAVLTDLPTALRGGVHLVHVCSPLSTHADVTHAVVAAGLPALVEKPLAPTAAETASLLAAADARGVVLCPVHQFPFQDGVRRVLRAIERLGKVRHVDYEACSAGGAHDTSLAADEIVADILPHPLSLFARILREPLHQLPWLTVRSSDGELRAAAQAGEASVALLLSMAGRPTRNTLRIIGTHGTAHVDLFHGFATVEPGAVSRRRKITYPFTTTGTTLLAAATNLTARMLRWDTAYPGLRNLVRAMHDAVRSGGPSPIPASETRDVALARERILAAGAA